VPHLPSDSGAIRLAIDLVQRETVRPGDPSPVRLLATAAVEWLDQRDHEWWPFVRLPPLWIEEEVAAALASGIRELFQGGEPGFAWQAGASFGLQLGLAEGDAVVVEIGVDLGAFLADASGLPPRAGGEAALFRFTTAPADLVRFGGAVEAQLRELAELAR
jgi:hypothetical protein